MTTQTQQIEATTPVAMQAVAKHLVDHDLAFTSIDAPKTWCGETSVVVHVPNDDGACYWSARWRDTLAVDGMATDPITIPDSRGRGVPAGLFERYTVHGRLPDMGVRVSVVAVRQVAVVAGRRALVSVPDGAA